VDQLVSRRLRSAGLAIALCTTFAVTAPAAVADPLGNARAQAAALQAEVDKLQTAAEIATEKYDAVEAQFGQAVTQHILAQRELQQVQTVAQNGASTYDSEARSLYEDGGQLSIIANVLAANSVADIAERYQDVKNILNDAHAAATATAASIAPAAALEAQLNRLARRQTRLQVAAAKAAAAVLSDLTRMQQALAAATAQVRTLEAALETASFAYNSAQSQLTLRQAFAAAGHDFANTTPPGALAAAAIAAAKTRLGDTYVWGGSGPSIFDCSGLTQWSYAQAGVLLPRVAADQWNAGTHVALGDLQPGDLLFWAINVQDPATIHHVAMYLGDGMMIAAPHTGTVVQIQPVYLDGYIGATRPT
jgi:cell wall-associated NlpC family hydrolase